MASPWCGPDLERDHRGRGASAGSTLALTHHERDRPGRPAPQRSRRRVSPGSTSLSTRWTASGSSRSPGATGSTPCSPASRAAQEAGLRPVKINTVLMRESTTTRRSTSSTWALDQGLMLRFIEQMPLDAQHAWSRTEMVAADEILEPARRARFTLRPTTAPRGSEPAETWEVLDDDGEPRGHRGRDRVGHPTVLLGLRPGPADERRSAAQLPVRQDRDRSAWHRCVRCRPTTSWSR